MRVTTVVLGLLAGLTLGAEVAIAQVGGTAVGEWHYWGGDIANTR